MPRVRITHTTEYRYARPVHFTTHRLMLRPRDSHDLRLLSATMGLTPPPATSRWAHDVFGNSVCTLDWDETEAANTLRLVSILDLEHFPAAAELPHDSLDPVAATYPFSYAAEEFPDLARLLERHHPDPERHVDAWARRFLRRGVSTSTLDLLAAMTRSIKADFIYAAREAEGTNPPVFTLESGQGACRDFALLMMEACRSLGLAARFVSGYLYDEELVDSAGPVVGGGTTHAWCAIYLPGAGWVEFDPTNGLVAGRNLIRVCMARTPEQAVPVAGGFIGRPGDYLGMSVDVQAAVGKAAAEEAQSACC
jgi:transglutaminase-like putative cysteine protease